MKSARTITSEVVRGNRPPRQAASARFRRSFRPDTPDPPRDPARRRRRDSRNTQKLLEHEGPVCVHSRPRLRFARARDRGRMPERSIGTDCKSVRLTPFGGSNPPPTTTVFLLPPTFTVVGFSGSGLPPTRWLIPWVLPGRVLPGSGHRSSRAFRDRTCGSRSGVGVSAEPVRWVRPHRTAARITAPDSRASWPRGRRRPGSRPCARSGRWCRPRTARWPRCRGPAACPGRIRC